MSNKFYFTSESVTEGHPDKICDKISDSILDEILKQDSNARVACETTVTTGMVHIMGEITTSCYATSWNKFLFNIHKFHSFYIHKNNKTLIQYQSFNC